MLGGNVQAIPLYHFVWRLLALWGALHNVWSSFWHRTWTGTGDDLLHLFWTTCVVHKTSKFRIGRLYNNPCLRACYYLAWSINPVSASSWSNDRSFKSPHPSRVTHATLSPSLYPPAMISLHISLVRKSHILILLCGFPVDVLAPLFRE